MLPAGMILVQARIPNSLWFRQNSLFPAPVVYLRQAANACSRIQGFRRPPVACRSAKFAAPGTPLCRASVTSHSANGIIHLRSSGQGGVLLCGWPRHLSAGLVRSVICFVWPRR